MPTNIRDPRSIVTPDAFELDTTLLGTPLAGPWRRFWAMMLDLVAIGVLTAMLDSIQLLIWGFVALFIIRMAFQRPGRASQAAGILLRVFAGCLGVSILAGVILVFSFLRLADDDGDVDLDGDAEVVTDVAEALRAAGVTTDQEGDAASPEPPDVPAPTGDQSERVEERGDADVEPGPVEEAGDPGDTGVEPEPVEERGDPGAGTVAAERAAALSDEEAVAEYVRLVREREAAEDADEDEDATGGAGDAERDALLAALRPRVVALVASDTLASLEEDLEDAEEREEELDGRMADLREELNERDRGLAALLEEIWDQAGSAIGLWSLYFTVMLTLWKGQTIGKKALGIRVMRLDGEPMTWWTSFERGGGYVAGIATGLLGFAQVFWDPNRQCIHDKIVGTVVVLSGAPPVQGSWLETHGAAAAPREADEGDPGEGAAGT